MNDVTKGVELSGLLERGKLVQTGLMKIYLPFFPPKHFIMKNFKYTENLKKNCI